MAGLRTLCERKLAWTKSDWSSTPRLGCVSQRGPLSKRGLVKKGNRTTGHVSIFKSPRFRANTCPICRSVLCGLERRVSIFSVLGLCQSRARFTQAEAGTPDGGVAG